MRRTYPFPISALVLVMVLAVVPPAMAKQDGQGHQRGGGHSSMRGHGGGGSHSGRQIVRTERRGNGGGQRYEARGSRSQGGYRRSAREVERRSYASAPTRSSSRGVQRFETRFRERPSVRTRETRTDTRGGSSGYERRPAYSSRVRYRHDDGVRYKSYSTYVPRTYYTSYFPRPRYVYRSGFSLGFVIGSYPSYGYRYWDPYCHLGFSYLGDYYDHCHSHRHSQLILVVYGGDPVASCVYRGGSWVVDDCYHEGYADGYDDGYDDAYREDVYYDDRW